MKTPGTMMSAPRRALVCAVAGAALLSSVATGAMAQRYDRGDPDHRHWGQDHGNAYSYRRGERMGYNDWHGAPAVNYRDHNLRRPRRGYEWREHNGHYVMVAIATGLIASVILNGPH